MNSTSNHYGCEHIGSVAQLALVAACLTLGLVAGCGSGGGTGVPPQPGNTTVTLLATSTANDQFASFAIAINSLALTSESGKTATLISKVLSPEFIHVNGTAEPLTTVSIPRGTYTSATISVGGAPSAARESILHPAAFCTAITPTAKCRLPT